MDYKNWKDIRNIQTHRMMSSQQNEVILFPPQPAGTSPKITWIAGTHNLDTNSTVYYRTWLTEKLKVIIDFIEEFNQKYIY